MARRQSQIPEAELALFTRETWVGFPLSIAMEGFCLTLQQGLLIGDKKGWQKVDRSAGLRGTVYSAFEDRQHSLWIGLAGRGLAQWRGYREWESYSTESGLASDLVYEILPQERWVALGRH